MLILGAGLYQVPLIEKVKSLGHRAVVCSIPGDYPGFAVADVVEYVNTTDTVSCLEVARRYGVSAVCTCGTDVALPSLGHINDSLDLCGPDERSAILSSNKWLMKEAFAAAGVLTAKYIRVSSPEQCIQAADELGYPCVIKVVDSSGSRGIEIVRRREDICKAYARVLPATRQDFVIVEEFLDGDEFGAQAMIYKGQLLFVMPHSDTVFNSVTGVPIGHSVPMADPRNILAEQKIKEQAHKAIIALGIDNSAVNIDFMMVKGQPYVLEVGARCGGTCLAEIVSIHYGIDYYELMVRCALGDLEGISQETFKPQTPVSAMLIISSEDGVYQGGEYRSTNPLVNECRLDCTAGDTISRFRVGPDRIGHIIVHGETLAEAQRIVQDEQKKACAYIINHLSN